MTHRIPIAQDRRFDRHHVPERDHGAYTLSQVNTLNVVRTDRGILLTPYDPVFEEGMREARAMLGIRRSSEGP